ncbi:hypothetical protein [Polynucleobacter yangtzensis]|jgi:ribosome-associated translation inhibitor RaiA|uniref:hypothetical protein n=1 Tax=Polynucleobacter yangtzensis TaxID=1743159 RepID=UPI0008317D30|nr:hypothetical protein [Polynucleobacter yangtzensis]
MSTELTLYFEQYAQNALDQLMKDLVAKSFYERILTRLQNKEDLSVELPIIKKVGIKNATTVVKAALTDYQKDSGTAWNLPSKLQEAAKTKVSQVKLHQEHLPRFDVLHQFATDAGNVKVHITTAGQNIKVELNAGRNKMAAQAAIYELEKQVSFANLSQT